MQMGTPTSDPKMLQAKLFVTLFFRNFEKKVMLLIYGSEPSFNPPDAGFLFLPSPSDLQKGNDTSRPIDWKQVCLARCPRSSRRSRAGGRHQQQPSRKDRNRTQILALHAESKGRLLSSAQRSRASLSAVSASVPARMGVFSADPEVARPLLCGPTLLADDSPRKALHHSHSLINKLLKSVWLKGFFVIKICLYRH